jgi:hypothetical protein
MIFLCIFNLNLLILIILSKKALGVIFMAKRSFIPGAVGVLNSAKYEIAREGAIDLEGLYDNESAIAKLINNKDKKTE